MAQKKNIQMKKKMKINYLNYMKQQKDKKFFRILKDEIDKLERNKDKYNELKEINYMAKEEFKEKYINKKRNLSQISYILLNYILYFHLFFSKLYIKTEKFDNNLPKGPKEKRLVWSYKIKDMLYFIAKRFRK